LAISEFKSKIRRKHAEDVEEVHRRSHPASHLQRGPTWQGKPTNKGDEHPKDKDKTHMSVPWPKAVASGPTWGSADPRLYPVQVQFGWKISSALLKSVTKFSILTSTRNCPWKL
jgi:hypothetical protein